MTQEEKQLLLLIKDLSARLPHGVKVSYPRLNLNKQNIFIVQGMPTPFHLDIKRDSADYYRFSAAPIEDCKPYLRPMSSMTEEEKLELVTLYLARDKRCRKDLRIKETELFLNNCWYVQITYKNENDEEVMSTVYIGRGSYIEEIDWLNAHHFDYRGLIKLGLALEAPEGMYN